MTKMASLTHRNPYVRTFMLFTQLAGATIKYMDTKFFLDFQISFIQYSVLRALVRNGGTLKHTQLAFLTGTKKHNITALVDRMKESDLVTTEWSQTDKRVNNVIVTKKGKKLYKQANQTARKMVEQLMHGMQESDVQKADRLLNMIKDNIERD